MGKCYDCGGEIIFRYVDGVRTPIHRSGGCFPGGSHPGGSYTTITSFVDPNARCPVCRDRVFFYRSPFDGRVFFDELGPPWPKHPCTDNAGKHHPLPPRKPPAHEAETSGPKAEWQRSGWKPFWCRKSEYKEDEGMTAIFGKMEGEEGGEWILFVSGEVQNTKDYPTLAKPKGKAKGRYQIATFRIGDKKRKLTEMYFDAYLPAHYR